MDNNILVYILAGLIIILLLVYGIMTNKVKEWLKYAVTMAEKELGSGTGQLKLREVYDWFLEMFPVFGKIVPFSIFSKWVDLALDWMREQLKNNDNISVFVNGVE